MVGASSTGPMVTRRDFLKWSAAGAAALGAGGLSLSWLGRRAWAAPFGEFPEPVRGLMLAPEVRAESVLEVFLYGGLSQWETLYMVEEYGKPTDPTFPNQQFYTFAGSGSSSVQAALDACGFPAGEPMGVPFGTDELGMTVRLGPFAYLLRQRDDVVSRMRLHVNAHDLEPHEAAIPLAMTGKPVGSPSMAGLGTHIQRYYVDRADASRKSPFSYVFSTGGLPGDNVFASFATGMHPGRARPLRIKIDGASRLVEQLGRPTVGSPAERAQYDALLDVYASQYRDRLRWKGAGEPVRSSRFAELETAAAAVSNAEAVKSVMDPSYFVKQGGSVCGDYNDINIPAMSFKLAAHLLTHPTERARYVCVVDTGLIEASGGGGYDTHTYNSHDQARNFKNCLQNLLGIINQPGEDDPTKLDLDKTLIILNTEFGRTPYPQDGGNGRNHHPYGYVTAMMGGPITASHKAIVGAIGPDARARGHVKPSESRIAALLALGIWPFSPEAFGVSDVQGVTDEADGVKSVTSRVLGYTV